MENAKIYLCKADASILGTLTGIQAQTCNLKRNITNLWELTFDVSRYIDADGRLVQSDYYDSIDDMMRLYLDSATIQAFFVIDSEPVIKGDGYQETKTVTAHSVECELCNIYLKNFKINCGTPDSQEYLACETDSNENKNYYNVNLYTRLPCNYISLVNYEDTQLSLMHLALQGTGWTVKEGIDDDICQIKKSFETSDSVYSFLMKTVSPAASVIFEFDRKHKVVGIVKAADYGEDTGVFLSMRNLMNSFEVTSTSNDSIITKLVPTGANNLSIESVNFGKDYLLNLDYFMNTCNEYGDYKFVSSELHDKYKAWKHYRESELFSICPECGKDNCNCAARIKGTRREVYAELTKRYNQTISKISELRNRVPNDGCMIDYKTYKLDELKTAYTAYKNALLTLITLYKNEYGVKTIGDAPNYTPTPEKAQNIKNTPYWHDFYAYREAIIPQVEEALKMYCQTDKNGNLVFDKEGSPIELEFGNPDYYAKEQIVKTVDAYLYEWSLYGLDELEAKKKAWSEAANLLFEDCFIVSGTASSPIQYRTADQSGWNSLNPEQKSKFTSMDAYIHKLNQYLDYMALEKRNNALTKTNCKGIIRQCEDEITKRTTEIDKIQQEQNIYYRLRKELADSAALNEQFRLDANSNHLFTANDINIINSMMREQEFSNENILTTSLDDIVTVVDVQKELYESAAKKLYELSQPQYSFRTELDNLYALDAFQAFQKPFDIGNFIRVGLEIHEDICANHFIKLRLISISHNPLCADESLSVEFSTMVRSLNGISDLAFLLGSESSGGGTSSSSSSGGGTYGNNDANVQISNNMLNALLSTELFGTAVSDVLLDTLSANKGHFKDLFSASGAFDALEAGKIKVKGDCLFDGIRSDNYTSTQNENGELIETGSILDLSNGTFSFAGGKLKWDNKKLYIGGELTAIAGITETEFNGDVNANNLSAVKGTIAGWKFDTEKSEGFFIDDKSTGISGKKYLGRNGILMGDLFNLNHDGFILKDILYRTNINNYTLTPQNLTNTYSGHPCRIYVYNYKNFDENQSFNIFFYYRTYLDVTILETDGEHGHSTFYIDNIVNQYRFKKEQIKNIHNLEQEERNLLLQKVDGTLLIDHIGYIDKEDLELIDSNLDDVCNENMNDYTILNYELSDEIIPYGVFQENPLIPDGYDYVYEDNLGHAWNIETGQPKLDLIGLCTSLNNYDINILSDLTSISRMTLNSYSKKIMIDDTYMTNKGFSSKYMYDNITVSGKALYIGSDGTIGLSHSSERFKNSISTNLTEISDPHGLYDIDIVQYKYNNDYFSSPYDEGMGKYFIGFIAEDIAKKFKDGATFDGDNLPDGWDIRYMFPAALKLIQEQHKEIETLKEQYKKLLRLVKEAPTNGDN